MKQAFEARFEERREATAPQGKSVRREGRILRDHIGRVRQDTRAETSAGTIVTLTSIIDPVAREVLFFVGESADSVQRMPLPAGQPFRPSNDWELPAVVDGEASEDLVVEDLGTKEIEGVRCRGRLVRVPGQETETWYWLDAPEQPVRIVATNLNERYTFQLSEILRREPDPGLFQVPR